MGMYATVEMSMKSSCVDSIARKYDLPQTKSLEDGVCYLNSRDVRIWNEKKGDLLMNNLVFNKDDVSFIVLAEMMAEDAQDYIGKKSREAGELRGKDRKIFLRKSSKEYKLIFV